MQILGVTKQRNIVPGRRHLFKDFVKVKMKMKICYLYKSSFDRTKTVTFH